MKKNSKRRFHSEEFKFEAVELAKRIGITKAAQELGVHPTSISSWRKSLENPTIFQDSAHSKKPYSELEKENKRLQKEVGYLKEINKVLKKSTAIFSSDHMGNLR